VKEIVYLCAPLSLSVFPMVFSTADSREPEGIRVCVVSAVEFDQPLGSEVDFAVDVGRSSLVLRLVADQFTDHKYDPVIEDTYLKLYNVDDKICRLELLDVTPANGVYLSMYKTWVETSDGILCVYSIVDRASFEGVEKVVKRMRELRTGKPTAPIIVAGTKIDLDLNRAVSKAEGQELAASLGCSWCETSAAKNIGVHEAFSQVVREVRAQRSQRPADGGKRPKCAVL